MNNLYNNGGFFWWVGVVEDRNDPLFLGRCRVRVVGYHNASKTELPTSDLPWAFPMQPITSAAMTGIGSAPVGPVEGTWVIGFFRDGDDCQEPIMMGTLGGISQDEWLSSLPPDSGFQDPNKKYPKQELRNEPDTNRLARSSKAGTIVDTKKSARVKGIATANGGPTWDQPEIPYAATYPFNHVMASEAGHVIEVDDTPSAERLHLFHRAGTFVEIDASGTMVRRIVGDDFQILERNGHILIKGSANLTVEGACNIYVKNDCNLEVDGKMVAKVHNDMELNVAGAFKLSADSIDIKTPNDLHVEGKNIHLKASADFVASATGDANVRGTQFKAYGTATAVLNSGGPAIVNGLGLKLMPGVAPTASTADGADAPAPTEKRTPVEPELQELGFKLSAEDREVFEFEKLEARENPSPEAQEYASLKQAELDSNERSAMNSIDEIEDIPIVSDCAISLTIVDAAKKDLKMIETGTLSGSGKNYGGIPGQSIELDAGRAGRIDEMMRACGLDNQAEVRRRGEGYYWCAAAVVSWWQQAGIRVLKSARCRDLAAWGKQKGLYSKSPAVGAMVLYGPEGSEYHIGIVVAIDGRKITTIEGNTSGGGFSRNGCGVFLKNPNPSRVSGYVLPPGCKPAVASTPSVNDDMATVLQKLRGSLPDHVFAELPTVIDQFQINTPQRLIHFLAQAKHESLNFTTPVESISESRANTNYANRLGNGAVHTGDGFKYRGRGYMQITGKETYAAFSRFVPEDVVKYPNLVAEKYPLLSAAWFWTKYKVTRFGNLNFYADQGTDVAAITKVSELVNGGQNGLAERISNFNKFWSRLS